MSATRAWVPERWYEATRTWHLAASCRSRRWCTEWTAVSKAKTDRRIVKASIVTFLRGQMNHVRPRVGASTSAAVSDTSQNPTATGGENKRLPGAATSPSEAGAGPGCPQERAGAARTAARATNTATRVRRTHSCRPACPFVIASGSTAAISVLIPALCQEGDGAIVSETGERYQEFPRDGV